MACEGFPARGIAFGSLLAVLVQISVAALRQGCVERTKARPARYAGNLLRDTSPASARVASA
jgi:hypothetical protein